MKVAKVFRAVNTPTAIAAEVTIGKRKLRVSNALTVAQCGGHFVGYSCLKKTDDPIEDRITIGQRTYVIQTEYNTKKLLDSAKYCICVDDVHNEWVAVVSKWVDVALISEGDNGYIEADESSARTFSISGARIAASIVACAVLITGFVLFTGKDKSDNSKKQVVHESTTEVTTPGEEMTYVYGVKLSDSPTAEELLEYNIAMDDALGRNTTADLTSDTITGNGNDTGTRADSGKKDSGSENEKDSAIEDNATAPYSSVEDTVIVSEEAATNNATTFDPMIAVTPPVIGNITLSDRVRTYSFVNNSTSKLSIGIKLGDKVVATYTLAANESATPDLVDVLKETCRPTIVWTYYTEGGKVLEKFSTTIMVVII